MGVMHYARKNSQVKTVNIILDQIGSDKTGVSHSLHSLSNKVKIINHFKSIYTMNLNSMSYIRCLLVIVYTYFTLTILFRDYLVLDQHDRGCIWRNLTKRT